MRSRWNLLVTIAVVALGIFTQKKWYGNHVSYVEIAEKVESLMKRRCENTIGKCESIATSYWDFEDGAKGYPYEEDSEWNDIRLAICGEKSNFLETFPQITSTTLLNRQVEVPYELPSEFLVICDKNENTIAGALFRKTVIQLLHHVDTSRLLNVEIPGQTWLWSLDKERNVLLSATAERTTFREPLERDVLLTYEMSFDSRCVGRRNRTYNKHADLMPMWGCDQNKHSTLRGMFRGNLRAAGELYMFRGQWHLDSDSSFSYYRNNGQNAPSSEMFTGLQHVETLLLSRRVAAPLKIHIFEKNVLFPSDDHISFVRKRNLIELKSNHNMDWPQGHRFECFPNALCTVLDRIGSGSSGTVYRVHVSILRQRQSRENDEIVVLYTFKNVVMKVFHEDGGNAASKAEATACLHVNAVSHPLLQQCLWYSENRTTVHLLFSEYVPQARDLESLIPVSFSNIWKILSSSAEAFDVIHNRGVIHNDVNSRNILVTEIGRTIVVDFGLAAPILSARQENYRAPVYARAYASPEQHGPSYRPRSDGSSDVWCFALTVLHVWYVCELRAF